MLDSDITVSWPSKQEMLLIFHVLTTADIQRLADHDGWPKLVRFFFFQRRLTVQFGQDGLHATLMKCFYQEDIDMQFTANCAAYY